MATLHEFPNNCITNVYTLSDFGEIAYIVCTVAVPPPNPDVPPQVLSLEETLARLRRTERQFREASILAALDVQARQLFTFYKKVDIANARDQKTLLSKFGYVLRSNACTIAYKTAARLPDLMKPEQSRLYRLFTAAIVSSIRLLPLHNRSIQAVGPNLYLVEDAPSASDFEHLESKMHWSLFRVDLQVILSGHIILTVIRENLLSFSRLADAKALLAQDLGGSVSIYLAPVGIIGRFANQKGGQNAPSANLGHLPQGIDALSLGMKEGIWKELLPQWLREHANFPLPESPGEWVEAQIAFKNDDLAPSDVQDSSSPPLRSLDTTTWKTVFWPADLCFVLRTLPLPTGEQVISEDTLESVQNWITGTVDGPLKDTQREQYNSIETDEEPLFMEDGAFDDPDHFHPFGPPSFPPNQIIYPTPPDVVMAHPTPGLSSVDGLVATPANLFRGQAEILRMQDEDMPDFDQPTASGAGYYDEDLFDEMPDDAFGQEVTGDEPNWDFFDEPGVERETPLPASQSHGLVTALAEHSEDNEFHAAKMTDVVNEALVANSTIAPDSRLTGRSGELSMENKLDHQPEVSLQIPGHLAPLPAKQNLSSLRKPDLARTTYEDGSQRRTTSQPRRPSVFDGIKPALDLSERDSKYATNGDFWFDPTPVHLHQVDTPSKFDRLLKLVPSSPSGTDTTDDSSVISIDQHAPAAAASKPSRQWTEYHPETPIDVDMVGSGLEEQNIRQETAQLLSLIQVRRMVPPSPSDFEWGACVRELPELSGSEISAIAHILVDQISQTCLLPSHDHGQEIPPPPDDDAPPVGVDLSGINSSGAPSTVLQLINLQAEMNVSKVQGKVLKLPTPQIRVRRANQILRASITIMEFWETLNLQPEHGSKDVTAFIVCPDVQSVRDGCRNLLQRMTDAYSSSLLGRHKVGQIPSLSDEGLITWSTNDRDESNLLRTCENLGTALSASTELEGLIVIYMISQSENPSDYLDICQGFYTLFGSFRESANEKIKILDIALQIIPQKFVASNEMLVIPAQSTYLRLAREVYNRLPPLDKSAQPGSCSSAVTLSKSEASVYFHLSANYSSPFSKSGPCLHVAYSISQDDRWVTAAWTDETGQTALTMSYCTQMWTSGPRRPRHDVFREIWGTSQDIMSKVQGTWRLNVVKNGHFDSNELKEWCQVEDEPTPTSTRCKLILLSVRLRPILKIMTFPPGGKSGLAAAQNTYGTPASTPQPSITSPDQFFPATPTPGGSIAISAPTPPELTLDPNMESDITLVDLAEESWSVILPYGVNQSMDMVEIRPALVTGLLVKRKGDKGEDGLISIEVSWINGLQYSASPGDVSPEELLEDVIRQYRGLVSLSTTRGCIDPNVECLPWHIATAVRGAEVLGEVL